jgi:hypothetical protein
LLKVKQAITGAAEERIWYNKLQNHKWLRTLNNEICNRRKKLVTEGIYKKAMEQFFK